MIKLEIKDKISEGSDLYEEGARSRDATTWEAVNELTMKWRQDVNGCPWDVSLRFVSFRFVPFRESFLMLAESERWEKTHNRRHFTAKDITLSLSLFTSTVSPVRLDSFLFSFFFFPFLLGKKKVNPFKF